VPASHGCIRLTNWDAIALAHLVRKGTLWNAFFDLPGHPIARCRGFDVTIMPLPLITVLIVYGISASKDGTFDTKWYRPLDFVLAGRPPVSVR
jgi:hypothetical protein